MKKQVILTTDEYESLVKIAADAAQLVDKYSAEYKGPTHVMDSEGCDPTYHSLFRILLYMKDEVKGDIKTFLPERYLDIVEYSVFYEGDNW